MFKVLYPQKEGKDNGTNNSYQDGSSVKQLHTYYVLEGPDLRHSMIESWRIKARRRKMPRTWQDVNHRLHFHEASGLPLRYNRGPEPALLNSTFKNFILAMTWKRLAKPVPCLDDGWTKSNWDGRRLRRRGASASPQA